METMLHMVKSQHSGSSDSSTNSEFFSHAGTELLQENYFIVFEVQERVFDQNGF